MTRHFVFLEFYKCMKSKERIFKGYYMYIDEIEQSSMFVIFCLVLNLNFLFYRLQTEQEIFRVYDSCVR